MQFSYDAAHNYYDVSEDVIRASQLYLANQSLALYVTLLSPSLTLLELAHAIHRNFFSAVIIENSVGKKKRKKIHVILIFLFKTLIVGTRENRLGGFVFVTQIILSLFFLNLKFQVSSLLLCLYSLVCTRQFYRVHTIHGLNKKIEKWYTPVYRSFTI